MYCREEKYDQFNGTLKCAYTYLADGTKVMVQDNTSSSASNGYLYLGSMVFRKTGAGYAFESTDFGGGRIINVNGTLSPYYYATDHLGSVRAITDAFGNVTERNDYYAFGKRMTTGGTYPVMTSNRWKYNGKEVQTTGNVNWLDYGAREYDEVTARWTRPDPMSEKYYGTSEYVFCSENPVNRFDNTGTEDDWVKDSKGNIYWDSNATSQATTKNGETYLGKAVAVFEGSKKEVLGKDSNMYGKGAKNADVTVYGPNGSEDIRKYQGFTMSSDPSLFAVVKSGEYTVNRIAEDAKPGPYGSEWTLNNRGKVAVEGDYNPAHPDRQPAYMEGVFIHRPNNNGWAGTYYDKAQHKTKGVSEGCLLIAPKQWDDFNRQLNSVSSFHLIIDRK